MTTFLYNTRLCPSASFAYFLLIRVSYIAMHPARCCLTMPLFVSLIPSLSLMRAMVRGTPINLNPRSSFRFPHSFG